MSANKKSTSSRATAAAARETAKRVGVRLHGSAREGVIIILLAACVFLLLALFSFQPEDPGWSRSGPETAVANWMGPFGAWLADVLYSLFGVSALWWPGMLGFSGWWLIRSRQERFEWDATALAVRCGGLVLLLLGTTTLGALYFFRPDSPLPYSTGGILGEGLVGALRPLVGTGGTGLLAIAGILCGMPLFTGLSWLNLVDELGNRVVRLGRWVSARFGGGDADDAVSSDVSGPQKVARSASAPTAEPRDDDNVDASVDDGSGEEAAPSWWRRLVPGAKRREAPDLEAPVGRREPGFDSRMGDDGNTDIPWDVAERMPSAKQPGGSYTEREAEAAAKRQTGRQDAARRADAPSREAREPTLGAAFASSPAAGQDGAGHHTVDRQGVESPSAGPQGSGQVDPGAALAAGSAQDAPRPKMSLRAERSEPRVPGAASPPTAGGRALQARTPVSGQRPVAGPGEASQQVPTGEVPTASGAGDDRGAAGGNSSPDVRTPRPSAAVSPENPAPRADTARSADDAAVVGAYPGAEHGAEGAMAGPSAPSPSSTQPLSSDAVSAEQGEPRAVAPPWATDAPDETPESARANPFASSVAPRGERRAEEIPDPVLPDDGGALAGAAIAGAGAASLLATTHEAPRATRGASVPGAARTAPTQGSGDVGASDQQRHDSGAEPGHGTMRSVEPAQEHHDAATQAPSRPAAASAPGHESMGQAPAGDEAQGQVATAEQGREAADSGPTLWTVEHLQSQRPGLENMPEPDGDLPSLRLLTPPEPHQPNYTEQELADMAELLEMRLREYGVKAEVVDTWPGPVITRFEIKPAAGVKVSKISNLAKDLARSLMVKSVRVVEVIPGRPTVGIEIPNPNRAMIRLREVIDSDRYQQEGSALTMALGQDIGGAPVVANLGKMPHVLVAGTTGSGKSVGVNAMLISMLLKATPDELRLIMVDPKMLELSVYDGIPHLLAPVVTDMKEAANGLRWCVAEMERRYKLMAAMGVRNIAGFNSKLDEAERAGAQVADPLWEPQPWEMHQTPPVLEKLPYIVVVIDEFADMFMIVGKKVEELIARLAQKARAAGIHLILATQRPSVDVVTGLIKANIPTRMAFQVSSRIDSRTILDQGGAENLLGHGDMLYLPAGSGQPTRVHGAFVDDDEVHRVVDDWKRRGEPEYVEEILSGGVSADALTGLEAEGSGDGDDAEQDAIYDEAVQFVTESRRASISAVQRRFKIGYNRAARLVEAMEGAGVVSTMGTNGSREVLAPPPVGN